MFLNRGVAPNCLVTDCALRMGGIYSKDTWFAGIEYSRFGARLPGVTTGGGKGLYNRRL
jgi:hypothetical protein